jgi:predicted DNA-binding WGR domain protein
MLIIEEKALHCRDETHNHDKIWAAATSETGLYLVVWGRRDTNYQSKTKRFSSMEAARLEFNKLVREKLGKGYQEVAFGDPRHGNIPSFGNQAGTNRNLITSDSLMSDLEAFTTRLARTGTEGLTLLEEDSLRLQFAQLKLKTEVILLDLAATDGQNQRRLKDTSQQMQHAFLELDSRTLTRPHNRTGKAAGSANLLDL